MLNKDTGNFGENIASKYLHQKGYKILDRNFNTRYGEIDLITSYKDKIVFIEVKTRYGLKMGKPYEAVNLRKIQNLKKAIHYYLLTKRLLNYKLRLDVLTVLLEDNFVIKEIKHYENVEMR